MPDGGLLAVVMKQLMLVVRCAVTLVVVVAVLRNAATAFVPALHIQGSKWRPPASKNEESLRARICFAASLSIA